nr:type I-C CRISPR-associated protein Cas8c/Csd1 [uncultured Butyrivibrio sp.]
MGLLQQACKTYDCHNRLIGIYREGTKAVLAPVGHITAKINVEITVDSKGNYISGRKVPQEEPRRIIPATIESMGRTSAPCAHPLCDQIVYIAAYNDVKRSKYLEQLETWTKSDYSHPLVNAVYHYVIGNTILDDLSKDELVKLNEDGTPSDEKMMIGWALLDNTGKSIKCWQDADLMKKYTDYYINSLCEEKQLCMLSGDIECVTSSHLKGAVPLFGNAKFISANDTSNFTYLGRFLDDTQAVSVGYVHSQKAHNALKWLVENQGIIKGGRVFLCWNPEGRKIPPIISPLLVNNEVRLEPSDYKKSLENIINGYKGQKISGTESVVIASFDAATTGRLSVTDYNEINISDFMSRLEKWDEYCSFYDGRFGMFSPSLGQIIRAAYGVEREERGIRKLVVDDKVVALQLQKLIMAKVENAKFPDDIRKNLVNRANNLSLYDIGNRNRVLHTTCSVIRKCVFEKTKEVIEMQVEPEKHDRSYQYGRLLAILEKAESDTYQENEKGIRETNAIKMQSVFSKRPQNTSRILIEQIKNAYYPRLKASSRVYYEKLIGEIFEVLSSFPEGEQNKALADNYLMGYYLQKNELYSSRKNNQEEE